MNYSINPSSRAKGEADVGLLVACKVQLSSEVIKWKTENLRLVKELDLALNRTDNLEGTMTKLVDRTKELEDQLARAEQENMLLKHRNASMSEEKNAIVQRLSSGFDKYHSFPSSENRSRLCREGLNTRRSSEPPEEDYIEVSQSLLNRMKLEMQKFKEMGCQYQLKNDKACSSMKNTASKVVDSNEVTVEECCTEDIEKDVTDLISKTQSIKQYLFNQRRKLQSLFNIINSAYQKEVPAENHKEIPSPSHKLNLSTRSSDVVEADDTFHSFPSPITSRQPVQREAYPGGNLLTPNVSELQKGFDAAQSRDSNQTRETDGADHKICPICEDSFRDKSQKVFEEHVMNHLERESISILDQYEII